MGNAAAALGCPALVLSWQCAVAAAAAAASARSRVSRTRTAAGAGSHACLSTVMNQCIATLEKRKKTQIINDEEVAKQLQRALNRASARQFVEKGDNSKRDGPHASPADNCSDSQSSAKRNSKEEIEVIDLT